MTGIQEISTLLDDVADEYGESAVYKAREELAAIRKAARIWREGRAADIGAEAKEEMMRVFIAISEEEIS